MKNLNEVRMTIAVLWCFCCANQNSVEGIIGLSFQSLFALKQALIGSRLPLGQQFVFLPNLNAVAGVTSVTTRRPTTLPVVSTLPTTVRPNTIVSIQQLFPGGEFVKYPPEVFPVGFQPFIPGLSQPIPQGLLPGQIIPGGIASGNIVSNGRFPPGIPTGR